MAWGYALSNRSPAWRRGVAPPSRLDRAIREVERARGLIAQCAPPLPESAVSMLNDHASCVARDDDTLMAQ